MHFKSYRNLHISSVLVIICFSVFVLLDINAISTVSVLQQTMEEEKIKLKTWYYFQTEILDDSSEISDYSETVYKLIGLVQENENVNVSIVDYWLYENTIMDDLELEVSFNENESDGVCYVGTYFPETIRSYGVNLKSINFNNLTYDISGEKKHGPYLSDSKIYLSWKNMDQIQRNLLLGQIINDINSGVVLTISISGELTEQQDLINQIQDSTGVNLIPYESGGYVESYETSIYLSVGKYIIPVIFIISIVNAVFVIRFWLLSNRKDIFIRYCYGYDILQLWKWIVIQIVSLFTLSLFLALPAELIYVIVFKPILRWNFLYIIEFLCVIATNVLFILAISIYSVKKIQKWTYSDYRQGR